jgi:hypothetical protein
VRHFLGNEGRKRDIVEDPLNIEREIFLDRLAEKELCTHEEGFTVKGLPSPKGVEGGNDAQDWSLKRILESRSGNQGRDRCIVPRGRAGEERERTRLGRDSRFGCGSKRGLMPCGISVQRISPTALQ